MYKIENKIIVSNKYIFIRVPYIHCFPGYMMNRHALDISVGISAGISLGFRGDGDSCELFEHAPPLKSSTSLSWILLKLLTDCLNSSFFFQYYYAPYEIQVKIFSFKCINSILKNSWTWLSDLLVHMYIYTLNYIFLTTVNFCTLIKCTSCIYALLWTTNYFLYWNLTFWNRLSFSL